MNRNDPAFRTLCRRLARANALYRAGLLDLAVWARLAAWVLEEHRRKL